MFIFAHIFLGALIGIGFSCLTSDRRFLPVCMISAVIPDLLDKPLALAYPGLLGLGRTIGHSFLFFLTALGLGLLIWHYRHTLLGIACAIAIFSHQILDAFWNLPSAWLFPFFGAFQASIIPDYVGHFFWLEVTSPSEWIFGCISVFILVVWYTCLKVYPVPRPITPVIRWGRLIGAFLLGAMGLYLLYAGIAAIRPFFAPTYDPQTVVMTALIALGGSVIILKWPGRECGIQGKTNADKPVTGVQ